MGLPISSGGGSSGMSSPLEGRHRSRSHPAPAWRAMAREGGQAGPDRPGRGRQATFATRLICQIGD